MMLTLRRVSEADVEALLADPDEVLPLLRDVDGVSGAAASMNRRAMERAIASVDRAVWADYAGTNPLLLPLIASQVLKYLQDHSPPELTRAEYLDLDKSWHILHTLITGSPEPSPGGLFGGEPVGPDGGYGPVHLLRPEVAAELNALVADLDVETIKARVDRDQLRETGVTFAQTEFELHEVEFEIEDYFPRLQKFLARTAAKKRGLLLILE